MGQLTDIAVQAAVKRSRRTGKLQRISDGNWLTLFITTQGGARWQQRYRYGGKQRTISFGSYPLISIASARELSNAARALLRQGIDPVENRRKEKAELRLNVANTFGAAVEAWYEFNRPRWEKATADKARQYVNKDLLPSLRKRTLASLTPQDLGAAIAKIEARGAYNVAKKTRQWCKAILNYAIARGWTTENPAEHLNAIAARGPATKNYAHLGFDELPELLRALDGYIGSPFTVAAIRLALWTANRPGITRTLKWNEIDLGNALWIIKENREGMKGGYSHVTPLPRQAVAMLHSLHKISGTFPYVFINRGDPMKPMSDTALSKSLAAMGFKGRQTAHGFRHLISTALNELGYQADWVERQLAHGDPDKIRGTYNKAIYLEPRRKMMQHWADYLENIQTNGGPMPFEMSA